MTDSESSEKQRNEHLKDVSKKDDIERYGNWISKAKAAKSAGLARPTLDEWIRSGIVPRSAIREEVKGKKTFYKLDGDEVIRIAKSRIADRPAEKIKQQKNWEENLVSKNRRLEARQTELREQIESLSAGYKQLEDSTKREVAAVRVTENLLREQLQKAEAEAKEARAAAAKATYELIAEKDRGFFKRLFN